MINIGRAIQHPFEDREWGTKLVLAALISLVPVLNFAMYGYSLDVLRNTADGHDVPLPTWNDLGRLFADGLKLFVVQLVYALPIIVVSLVVAFGSVMIAVVADNSSRSGQDTAGIGITVISLGFSCLSIAYGLVIAFISPALYIQLVRTHSIGACFRLGELWAMIQRNLSDYLIILALTIGLGVAIGVAFTVLFLIPCVGICASFIAIPLAVAFSAYYQIVCGHLYGQLARQS